MTDLLYQTDSYLREFDATVVAVDAESGRVALDRTAFYPGGGGQPCDLGTLTCGGQTVAVTQVKKEGTWCGITSPPSPLSCEERGSRLPSPRRGGAGGEVGEVQPSTGRAATP